MSPNALDAARSNPALFYAGKPLSISKIEWIFSNDNPHRLPNSVKEIVAKLLALCEKRGFAWPHQKWLANIFDLSERWIKKIISWLVDLEIVIVDQIRNGDHYQNRYFPGRDIYKKQTQSSPGSSPAKTKVINSNTAKSTTCEQQPRHENKDMRSQCKDRSPVSRNMGEKGLLSNTFTGSISPEYEGKLLDSHGCGRPGCFDGYIFLAGELELCGCRPPVTFRAPARE